MKGNCECIWIGHLRNWYPELKIETNWYILETLLKSYSYNSDLQYTKI